MFDTKSCDLQLFIDKNMFLEKKVHFFGNKTVDQRSGAQHPNTGRNIQHLFMSVTVLASFSSL